MRLLAGPLLGRAGQGIQRLSGQERRAWRDFWLCLQMGWGGGGLKNPAERLALPGPGPSSLPSDTSSYHCSQCNVAEYPCFQLWFELSFASQELLKRKGGSRVCVAVCLRHQSLKWKVEVKGPIQGPFLQRFCYRDFTSEEANWWGSLFVLISEYLAAEAPSPSGWWDSRATPEDAWPVLLFLPHPPTYPS